MCRKVSGGGNLLDSRSQLEAAGQWLVPEVRKHRKVCEKQVFVEKGENDIQIEFILKLVNLPRDRTGVLSMVCVL